jgi:protein O-mannosyl-transferase
VAWIAERKDVLSIFFGMIALLAYVRYATGAGRMNLGFAFVGLALSLMAKQTLVTLPFVFLLLDFWPLGMRGAPGSGSSPETPLRAGRPVSVGHLILEKIPFFGLSAVFSIVASLAQAHGGAVVEVLPLHLRLMNAVVVYVIYLGKTLIPINLSVFYPHPGFRLDWTQVVVPGVLLLALSAFALAKARRLPYLFVGWCWYLGTLVPMIGVVQIGGQQMADRYTYFPLIGIFLAVTWLVAQWAPVGAARSKVLPAGAVVVVAILGAISFHQVGHWRNSISLLGHVTDIMPDHPTPHEYLGAAYLYAELPEKAIPELETAIRLAPPYALLQYKLASTLDKVGRGDEAIEHYEAALALDEQSAKTHNDFAVLLMSRHQDAEAKRHLERALQLDPDLANAHANLSLLCAKTHDYARAIAEGERALALDPRQIDCYHYVAVALRGEGRFNEAIRRLQELIKIAPDSQVARKELEITQAMQQRQRP